ncbi:response regulator transcription factor [Eubacterium xylanophilum]|uniref:response regulator transcription factor n=1 Tax=Eubacterium xylanophilum TaxID=39497 RepID=UPI00047D9041|nr:response regulator transcription factor [Eubacterium xylanophilum]
MKILIVEDDPRLGDTLLDLITSANYTADLVDNGNDGLDYCLSDYYDLIILDVMLPGKNGFEIVSQMRAQKKGTPVLMLTAKSQWNDKVKGLDSGADDYLTKPFVPEELFARIRALTRRKGEVVMNTLEFNGLILYLDSAKLEFAGKSVRLTSKEFEIMKILLMNPSKISSKEDLISNIWEIDSDVGDNNIEVYISFLRKKLTFIKSNVKISTIRKIGYCLDRSGE